MKKLAIVFLASACAIARAENFVVQIDGDGNTLPPNSVATPAQVETLAGNAAVARTTAATALQIAEETKARVVKYSTNYVVTSTVFVRSVGAVAYDDSNQHIVIASIAADKANNLIRVVGVLRQAPITDPKLDWRISLTDGEWGTITSDVMQTAMPAGFTGERAYLFTLPMPHGAHSFFRVVDNSTGVSGSGNYWLVYNGIYVDGKPGMTATVEGLTFRGGVLVEPVDLGLLSEEP